VTIARGTLSAICRAVNILTPKDSSQLHNLPLLFKLVVEDGTDGVKRNKVKGYKPFDGQAPAAPASAKTAAPTQAPAVTGGPAPWGQKKTG
jgi:hypothetical protein